MKRTILLTLFSSLLLLLFLYAAFSKIFDPEAFAHELHKQPFSEKLQAILFWIVPKIEILTAIWLCVSIFNEKYFTKAFLWSSILMGIFTVYTCLAMTKAFGHVPCSCGGIISLLNWKQHLVFDSFFLAISIFGYSLSRKSRSGQLSFGRKLRYESNH